MRKHRISRLQYITQDLETHTHRELAALACANGVSWVQLRTKNRDTQEWLQLARDVRAICQERMSTFIVNDSVEIALEVGADGVHLGQEDCSIEIARRLLGDHFIIGGTANTPDEAICVAERGADYIGCGPFRFTRTKKNLKPILGINGVQEIVNQVKKRGFAIPIVVVGGVEVSDVQNILQTGAYGVAVASVIGRDPSTATEFLARLREGSGYDCAA